MASEREELEQEWELSSLTLLDAEKKLQEHGQNGVVIMNRMNRPEAVLQGDHHEKNRLSDVSDTQQKFKKKESSS